MAMLVYIPIALAKYSFSSGKRSAIITVGTESIESLRGAMASRGRAPLGCCGAAHPLVHLACVWEGPRYLGAPMLLRRFLSDATAKSRQVRAAAGSLADWCHQLDEFSFFFLGVLIERLYCAQRDHFFVYEITFLEVRWIQSRSELSIVRIIFTLKSCNARAWTVRGPNGSINRLILAVSAIYYYSFFTQQFRKSCDMSHSRLYRPIIEVDRIRLCFFVCAVHRN